MQFPSGFPNRQNGAPLIGQQQVPTLTFQIQISQEFTESMQEFAAETGLDGASLCNYVFARGLAAIKGDLLYAAQEDLRQRGESDDPLVGD